MSISDLPPELVLKILGSGPRDQQQDFLLAASLVCRQWRPIAQGILWETVILDLPFAGTSHILSSPALGRYRTRELMLSTRWVSGQEQRQAVLRTAISALDHLNGIESLQLLLGVNDFSPSLLQNPNLAGLFEALATVMKCSQSLHTRPEVLDDLRPSYRRSRIFDPVPL